MGAPLPHESAARHVTGEAVYIDDIVPDEQLLSGRVVYSPHAHARIASFDLTEARATPGVLAVLSCRDIPGRNQMGPVVKDEPCLADGEVVCRGQAVFLIAGEDEERCREAESRIRVSYEPLDAVTTLEKAIQEKSILGPPLTIRRGDPESGLRSAPHVLRGELRTGAQEHWYLESQVCLCIPGEGREMNLFSSTQHPTETQALVAELLGIGKHDIVVEVRRMGGAFGGKETQANHVACWAALLCRATRRPVKIRLFRDDDMIITGKRHRFLSRYEVGYDDDGRLLAAIFELNSDGGCATDLSFAIMQRAMLHVDNAYYLPHVSVVGKVYRTNLPSNTAFRGFGGPQGMALIEQVVDRIARAIGKDALDVRRANFYGTGENATTHYGATVEQNRLPVILGELLASSGYAKRRAEVEAYNAAHEFTKKGLAATPVKFGISFTTSHLNQAGALVHLYLDGTVLVSHGGTEMGQGLHTKIRQIAALELGLPVERIRVGATNTSKVPNTSATAASSGTDLNGMAVKNAIDTLKERCRPFIAERLSAGCEGSPTDPSDVQFENGRLSDARHPGRSVAFEEAMSALHARQVSLSATGFYRTPEIAWDKAKGTGRPFYYYAFGMAVTEVLVDVLLGEHTVLRADILHDVGDSLNPAIDIGQVEGGYVQGLGWVTMEEVKWDEKGYLLTHSPDTYKIPAVTDIPLDFRTRLLENAPQAGTIRNSKAVAEPPFMLALSAWLAIKDAISAVAGHRLEPVYSLPATREVILLSVEELKARLRQAS